MRTVPTPLFLMTTTLREMYRNNADVLEARQSNIETNRQELIKVIGGGQTSTQRKLLSSKCCVKKKLRTMNIFPPIPPTSCRAIQLGLGKLSSGIPQLPEFPSHNPAERNRLSQALQKEIAFHKSQLLAYD